MPEFKLVGGPRAGRIVVIDNPFLIETQLMPRIQSGVGLVYDRYTRREWHGVFFYVAEELDDLSGMKEAGVPLELGQR